MERARAKPSAGSIGRRAIPRGSHDGDVGLPLVKLLGLGEQRAHPECRRALIRRGIELGAQPGRNVSARLGHAR